MFISVLQLHICGHISNLFYASPINLLSFALKVNTWKNNEKSKVSYREKTEHTKHGSVFCGQ